MKSERNMMKSNVFSCGSHRISIGAHTYVMGILNVTPDSFSDGGHFEGEDAAKAHAERMCLEGASIIDVGGESTRPGFSIVDEDTEISRVVPVIASLNSTLRVPISIDTYKGKVAEAALAAGASIINDVTGLHHDVAVARVAAMHNAGLVLMFNAREERQPVGDGDIVERARVYLSDSIEWALNAGVHDQQILLDPGIGFGVSTNQSLALIRGISELKKLGYPILVGPSRKRFIGDILGLPVDKRDIGTLASCAVASMNGADFVRVHSVGQAVEALAVVDAIMRQERE